MHRYLIRCLTALCMLTLAANAQAGRLRPGRSALVEPLHSGLIGVALDIGVESRTFRSGALLLHTDTTRLLVNAGGHALPWLYTYAGAGWMQSDLDGQTGEGGFTWQAAADINLIEQVIAQSPVAGVKQALGLTLEARYRYSRSNRGTDDFDWHEVLLNPQFHYTVTRADNPLRDASQPEAAALLLGLQFNDIDGNLGAWHVRGNRDFAGVAGVQFLLASQWSSTLKATFYGAGDRAIDLRLGRHF